MLTLESEFSGGVLRFTIRNGQRWVCGYCDGEHFQIDGRSAISLFAEPYESSHWPPMVRRIFELAKNSKEQQNGFENLSGREPSHAQ